MCIKNLFKKNNANKENVDSCSYANNEGYLFVMNCQDDVKRVIEDLYGSLDAFYKRIIIVYDSYHRNFSDVNMRNKIEGIIFDEKEKLISAGIDLLLANELFTKISNDYDKPLCDAECEKLLGPNWNDMI